MKIAKLLERICYGPRTSGERVKADYEVKLRTTIPGLVPRPSEKEWMKEFNVGSQHTRFEYNKTAQWYGDESPEEYDEMLRRILTGSR